MLILFLDSNENYSVKSNSATSKQLVKMTHNDYSEPSGQCRLLLVSLLDNFCSMYDRNPRKNQKLFSSLCRKLSSMGILNSLDFMEESKSIRSVYREAFKAIVVEAVKAVDKCDDIEFKKSSKLSSRSSSVDSFDLDESNALVEHTFTHFFTNTNDTSITVGEEIFLSGRSRYKEDFVEGGVLGRGGYGKVVIATNKLDGNSYAIKKINFSGVSSTRFTRILREVKSLARLDHPNIVRYNSAWIEDHSVILERAESDEKVEIIHELDSVKHEFVADSEDLTGKFQSNDEDTFTSGQSDNDSDFKLDSGSDIDSSSEHSHVFHMPSSHSNSVMHSRHPSDPSRPQNTVHNHHRFQFQDRKIMYIQMELCRFTLDQYIKARNAFYFECLEEVKRTKKFPKDRHKLILHDKTDRSYSIPSERLFSWNAESGEISLNPVELDSIFKGIVKGLHYIHENGMIHRDLKPMNIFFHNDLSPKIGDFGLVSEIKCSCGYNCSIGEREDNFEMSPSLSSSSHTKGVGTVTYASPEQLNQEDYTLKSDIYSLGIICFELFYPVATQMERTRVLTDLKQRHKFPESFLKQWPKEAAFIWSCIARDSEVRPSTAEILESEWLERDQDEIISRLEHELSVSRKREEDLIKSLEELKKENEMLKKKFTAK